MTKTARDIATRALRELGIVANDDAAQVSDYAYALDAFNGCLAELSEVQGAAFDWDADTVPDAVARPLALWVAADIAPHYMVAAPTPRHRAIAQVRAFVFPDDREDARDLDGDGVVSDAEAAAAARAAFF